MKQVVIKKGAVLVLDVKPELLEKGNILVDICESCISPGTEISSVSSSGKSLLAKAKSNPDKLKRALERMKTEGVLQVFQKAIDKQSKEAAIGYSAAGVVMDVASDVHGFFKGMRVAIAGSGHANHADLAVVPVNLAVPIPNEVSFREASTCALGGIALQGVRRAETGLGEINAVFGCGAIGLITLQLLKASGCTVVAIDVNSRRLEIAKKLGADATFNASQKGLVESVVHFSGGYGIDKVIITASTKSNTVLSQAFGICRKKGRVVLVGVIGPEFHRHEMYAKELDFVISTSYGPGRYDEQYERFGHDYPYGYVRWTEKRNIEAYLGCIAKKSVILEDIIQETYPIEEASQAYASLNEKRLLLVTLKYPEVDEVSASETVSRLPVSQRSWSPPRNGIIRTGLAGAGNFFQSMHIPHLKRLNNQFNVVGVCNRTGLSSRRVARNFTNCKEITRYDELLLSDIDLVMIGTRHNSHAEMSIRALEAGKAVFVEKPMCIARSEYEDLCRAIDNTNAPFMVGYNRRFSPFAAKIHQQVRDRINPLIIQYTMNAGYVPYSSWVHTSEGGGRIIGECCHIFDLFRFLVGCPVVSVSVDVLTPNTNSVRPDDNTVVTLKYEDGSMCTLLYTAIGTKKAEKETMKVFCDEQLFELHDYQILKAYGVFADLALKRQDKGHFRELQVFAECLNNGVGFPIPLEELKETWEISRQVADITRTEV